MPHHERLAPRCKGCKLKSSCIILRRFNRLKYENKKLRELLSLDPMTGLYNVRSMLETLANEIKKTARTGEPTSVIMIDLDDFKKVNDTYGHIVGDMVLKEVARIIKSSVRASDRAFRYGGEEFVIILSHTRLDDAIKVAERIRKSIESRHICSNNICISITASLGVFTITNAYSFFGNTEMVLDAADQLLLKAKKKGKNVVMWESDAADKAEVSSDERKAILSLFRPEEPEAIGL
ncbi:MAG: GGDEF domain-containing protein [Syntrophobacterales bacterium]|nr:GGDEF domain-containing protein [Syntrophobacterales bacterium]